MPHPHREQVFDTHCSEFVVHHGRQGLGKKGNDLVLKLESPFIPSGNGTYSSNIDPSFAIGHPERIADFAHRAYAQHRIEEAAHRLIKWVLDDGATIFVCGGLKWAPQCTPRFRKSWGNGSWTSWPPPAVTAGMFIEALEVG